MVQEQHDSDWNMMTPMRKILVMLMFTIITFLETMIRHIHLQSLGYLLILPTLCVFVPKLHIQLAMAI